MESTATHEQHDLNQTHWQHCASVHVQKPWRNRSMESDITVNGCKTQLVWSGYSLTFLWDCWLIIESMGRISVSWRYGIMRKVFCLKTIKFFFITWCWMLFCSCHLFFHCVFMAVPRRQQSLWQKGDKGLKINFKDVLSVHVPLVERVNLSALSSSSDFTPGDVSWDFNCFSVAPWWRESRVYPGIS